MSDERSEDAEVTAVADEPSTGLTDTQPVDPADDPAVDPLVDTTTDTAVEAERDAANAPADSSNEDLRFVVVEVTGVSFPIPSPTPMVHLREADAPFRALEFPIGLAEAQAIGLALEKQRAPRPSTHELLASVVIAAGCDVIAVRITGESAGTLLAELDLMTIRGREVLDCRPTDAIAVALRQTVAAPILVETTLLDFL